MLGNRRTLIKAILSAIALGYFAGSAQAEDCKLIRQYSADALVSRKGGLLIPIQELGAKRYFMLDTGAVAGLIYQDVADAEGLKVVTSRAAVVGASGAEVDRVASSLIVKGVPQYLHLPGNGIDPWIHYVVDRPPGGDPRESGTVGTNYYGGSDLEIDFPAGKVALYSNRHCDGKVVYWAEDYLVMPLVLDSAGRAFITVTLDGKQLRALIDTGASNSGLSFDAAKDLFGLSPGSPGVEHAGITRDITNIEMATYRRQFGKLDIGGIAFNNTWLNVTDKVRRPGTDMVLGRYHLRKLHLFFAFAERKLYATVGPEAASDGADSYDSVEWKRCAALSSEGADIAISGCSTVINAGTKLQDHLAAAYALRGEAYSAKGDQASAQRDFDAAFRVDPDSADVLMVHGRTLAARGDREAALRAFDKAVQAAPEDPFILLARADVEIAKGSYATAAKDLIRAADLDRQFNATASGANGTAKSYYEHMKAMAETIIKAQPMLADGHIALADILYYLRNGAPDPGSTDPVMKELDLAITNDPAAVDAYLRRSLRYRLDRQDLIHAAADLDQLLRLQPKSVDGLLQRCAVRALMSRLDEALADCNAALQNGPKASIYAARGFVHFKAGRFDQAIADFSEALRTNPDYAFALYGRGLSRKSAGDSAAGDADIAAAKRGWRDIERTFFQ